MAKNKLGTSKRMRYKNRHSLDILSDLISAYDPDFLVLPALLVVRRVSEKVDIRKDVDLSFSEVIGELNIGKNSRAEKIIKLAKKIIKTK